MSRQFKRNEAMQADLPHAGNHVIMRSVVRAPQRTHAGECCGRVGVQRGVCCVLEARVVQIARMITAAGRPHTSVESNGSWMVPTQAAQEIGCASSLCVCE